MDKIVEMIPDDIPQWAVEAMEKGQLFITMLDIIKMLERRIIDMEIKNKDENEAKIPNPNIIPGPYKPSEDNWKHRSANMSCTTCMWFVLKKDTINRPIKLGRCRRHAPTMSGWPVMFGSDWCGDHKLDENAI